MVQASPYPICFNNRCCVHGIIKYSALDKLNRPFSPSLTKLTLFFSIFAYQITPLKKTSFDSYVSNNSSLSHFAIQSALKERLFCREQATPVFAKLLQAIKTLQLRKTITANFYVKSRLRSSEKEQK